MNEIYELQMPSVYTDADNRIRTIGLLFVQFGDEPPGDKPEAVNLSSADGVYQADIFYPLLKGYDLQSGYEKNYPADDTKPVVLFKGDAWQVINRHAFNLAIKPELPRGRRISQARCLILETPDERIHRLISDPPGILVYEFDDECQAMKLKKRMKLDNLERCRQALKPEADIRELWCNSRKTTHQNAF